MVKSIIHDSETSSIRKTEHEAGIIYAVQVSKKDMPYIIGRAGETVKAIKTVMRVAGAKLDMNVDVNVLEPSQKPFNKKINN